MIRLANQNRAYRQIALYTGCHWTTVKTACRRYRQHGEAGLTDQSCPGREPRWNADTELFVRDCLAQDRTWTCNQLSEAIKPSFGTDLKREPLRLYLHQMGYTWQKTRCVPAQTAPPAAVALAQDLLEMFKKGRKSGRWHYGSWTNVA